MLLPRPNTILRHPWLLPQVLILGLGLTLLSALTTRYFLVRRGRERMEVEATIAQEHLVTTLQAYQDILLGFRGQLLTTRGFTRESFHRYYESLEVKAHHPGLLAISYGVPVAGHARAAMERDLRSITGEPDLTIHPPGVRDSYFVLLAAEPPENNTASLGMDTRTVPGNSATIDLARDQGELVITGPMTVLQTQDPGLLMRLPIYRGQPTTLDERRQAFQGCLSGVFRVRDLIQEALGTATLGKLEVRIEDIGRTGQPIACQTLYGNPLPRDGYTGERLLEVGGRTWRLQGRGRPEWRGHQDWTLPAGIGAAGCLITFLLWGLMLSLSRTGQRARLLAQRMMDQLLEEQSRTEAMALAMPDPMAILDGDGRILHLYGQHESILGTPRSELAGHTLAETLPATVAARLSLRVARALETHQLQTAGFELDGPEGKRFFEGRLLSMGQPVDGRPCVVLSIRDITENIRTEEIARTTQKLESLGVLAGGIAHDFNNFLTAILGHINLAQETIEPDAHAGQMLRRAEASVLRAAELAHQMLAYSGRGSLKVDYLDLNRVVTEMTELLAVSISKKAALSFNLEPGLPMVMADAVQIQQVVMNLVTNASEALGDQGGSIRIETLLQRADSDLLEAEYPGQGLERGTYILLRVADSGCGMDAETRKRIFDPFFTTKTTGRGFGLSALLGILKGHGAGIRILSEPGQGSTFEVLFPSAGPSPFADGPVLPSESNAPLEGLALIADDEPTVRAALSGILRAQGMAVLEACDGLEAMELFQRHEGRIDLVLLDITMPRMDGNEAFRLLRARAPHLPIILLSGFTSQDVALPPPGTAPALFVPKPFRAKDLEAAIRRVLKR